MVSFPTLYRSPILSFIHLIHLASGTSSKLLFIFLPSQLLFPVSWTGFSSFPDLFLLDCLWAQDLILSLLTLASLSSLLALNGTYILTTLKCPFVAEVSLLNCSFAYLTIHSTSPFGPCKCNMSSLVFLFSMCSFDNLLQLSGWQIWSPIGSGKENLSHLGFSPFLTHDIHSVKKCCWRYLQNISRAYCHLCYYSGMSHQPLITFWMTLKSSWLTF